MNESDIRRIVQQEILKSNSDSRFGLTMTNRHSHSGGNDGLQISANNILRNPTVSGSITLERQTTYNLNLNGSFTPSFMFVYGNVIGDASQKYMTFGTAGLGSGFFFQPLTNDSVYTGNVQYPTYDSNVGATIPLQSSVYYGAVSAGGAMHTLASEGHVVRVGGYPSSGDVYISATVTVFSKTVVQILVDTLVSGWSINANFVII